jgi:hypothetical protein
MNALSNHYGPRDGRYHAAKAIEAVVSYAIENLADGRGGTITMLPMNELEDITVFYRSQFGGLQISQISIQDDDVKSVDIIEEELTVLINAANGIKSTTKPQP